MASMQFVVKYFSEIVMKSKPVRRQFVRQLEENLRAWDWRPSPEVLARIDEIHLRYTNPAP